LGLVRNVAEELVPELLTDRNGRVRSSSVPPDLLSPNAEADLRAAAARFLPPAFRTLVESTQEPFIQTIIDLSVSKMAVGRVALAGDAAFVARPHAAASTSKAAGKPATCRPFHCRGSGLQTVPVGA
jgi:2-polyprenyl-6-methoxyphenol hydroxylase-like FAD-dependent oxidoreductase